MMFLTSWLVMNFALLAISAGNNLMDEMNHLLMTEVIGSYVP